MAALNTLVQTTNLHTYFQKSNKLNLFDSSKPHAKPIL